MHKPILNTFPVIIDEPGIYMARNGSRVKIHAIVPYVDTPEFKREDVTAFEAKGARERKFRGQMRFKGYDIWHVSGRHQPVWENGWDIVAKVSVDGRP